MNRPPRILLSTTKWRSARSGPLLRCIGYEIDFVGTGRNGGMPLSIAARSVVLDLGLPDLDGTEVCRRIGGYQRRRS